MEIKLRGIGVSPGIAIAPALVFDVGRFEVPEYRVLDTAGEWKRLESALESARNHLQALQQRTATELGESHADIFKAHQLLLEDVTFLDEVKKQLHETRMNIEHVLATVTRRFEYQMQQLEDPLFADRAVDLVDVVDRVLRHLLDTGHPSLRDLDQPSIIVAHELTPSDTASMNTANALGVAVDSGNVTSHTAILARALEIPGVMGLGNVSSHIKPGVMLIIDGATGEVIIDPDKATIKRYEAAGSAFRAERDRLERALETTPGKTLDGMAVETQANIELPVEIAHSKKVHAHGIGLYRTEYLFLNRNNLPTEEEQFQAYAEAAKAMNPFPVTLRTMDIGGDKFVSHLHLSKEDNPQLGWRAVRFCLERPDIFKVQIRAMLRATMHGNVQIMFPMISGVQQMRDVKAVLREVMKELRQKRIPFDEKVPLGSMIEVPSAVLMAEALAKECDFFSIGTNDLIQYTLAVDRVNERIAYLYEPTHPAVLRMIEMVANAAHAARIPCKLCGEMAGDPRYTELLLGLGVTSLSMSTISLPGVRAEIARVRLEDAKILAQEALQRVTAQEVQDLLGAHRAARPVADGDDGSPHDG